MKTKTITVEVKQKHIKSGVRFHHKKDPICLALNDMGYKRASIGDDFVWLTQNMNNMIVIPRKVMKFMSNFDNGLEVKPFKFTLEI
jgi:hypothetical protein